jgi:hypothetical protein
LRKGGGGLDFRSDDERKNEVVRMLVLAVALVALVALVSGGCSDGGEVSLTEPPKPTTSLLVQAPPERQRINTSSSSPRRVRFEARRRSPMGRLGIRALAFVLFIR